MKHALAVLGIWLSCSGAAAAQQPVFYDSATEGAPAAVSCGFCGNDKYGMVFRPLDSGLGLRADRFPLNLNRIDVAVARTAVTCTDCVGGLGCFGCSCMGSTDTSNVSMMVEAYAGATPPRGDIQSYPVTGPWSGETMVFAQSIELHVSAEATPGTAQFNIMVNQIMIDPAVRIDPPNTYIRVVVTVPSGSGSDECDTGLGLPSPGAVGIRDDDGRIENNVDFIYSTGGVGPGWFWNESDMICDELGTSCGINGDWVIRLDVRPLGSTGTDAGMPMPDAGTPISDAGLPMADAGMTSMDSGTAQPDAGSTSPMCGADADCAGGERCVEGMCRRVSCTAASDCAGGMTCVDGMCRNLCSSNAECNGGEVCDDTAGYCVPVTTMDGGCGCRAAGGSRGAPLAFVLAGVIGLALRRRRQLARRV